MDSNSALEQQPNQKTNTIRHYWKGLNFLITCSFLHLLCFSLYIGDWGLSKGNLRIFIIALISYFFINILPAFWLSVAYGFFTIFSLIIFKTNNLELIYILSLMASVFWFKLKKIKWFYYILMPILIHFIALSFYSLKFMQPFNWEEFGLLIHNISEKSLLFELISIYPIIGLAKLFNKLLNSLRFLE